MSKIIITGVSGQDGSYMSEYLVGMGAEVYGVVRHVTKPDYSNLDNVIGKSNFKLVVGDLSDTQSIDRLVSDIKPDYFFNFGAQAFVGSSWKLPEQTFDVNAMGVLRCLEAIRKFAPNCRFYQAGTSEMWGDIIYTPQDEDHPFRPQSPYGAAKCAAHHLTRVYRESYGLYALSGILLNHESERRGECYVTRKITLGVARIWNAIQKGQEFEPIVLGNLSAKRDWSHAKDFVKGIWAMMNQDHIKEEEIKPSDLQEYVLSSGETHTVSEFVEKAFYAAGIPIKNANSDNLEPCENGHQINYTLEDGRPVVVVSKEFYRPAEVNLLLGCSDKINRDLGWSPKVSFDSLVRMMVASDIEKYV